MDQKFNTKDRMIFFGIKPSKSLGQNFLNDISVVQEIVYSANLTKEDIVVEVGPGLGVMTDLLANDAGLVIAVEIDKNLIPPLQAVCDVHDNIELINGDILKVNVREIVAQRIEESNGTLKNVKVVANLPYYITTPIIFSFLENKMPQLRSMTFMVKKEVAIKNEDSDAEVAKALDAEAEKIIAAMPSDSYKIALCIEGTQYDSPRLADIISSASDKSGKISLVIGSSHGLSELVKRECNLRLSVSKMTFPHQLMRVILMEALYRSFTIIAGKRYHK